MNILKSPKTARNFLEQTVGQVVLEASMHEAGMIMTPMYDPDGDPGDKPKAIVLIATGRLAAEAWDFYHAFVELKKKQAQEETDALPLMQAAKDAGEAEAHD